MGATEKATVARNVWNFDPNDLVIIGKDTDDGKDHNLYDPRIKLPLSEAMVLSIMAQGVLENVTVASIDGKPVVVDGRRRVLHAREALARLRKDDKEAALRVPATFRKDSDAGLFATMIIANSHRLNDHPVVEARKAEIMQQRHNASDDEIAKAFGWTTQTLRNRRKLLTLPEKVLRKVQSGEISVTAATELAKMDPEDATAAAEEMAEESGGSTHGQGRRARAAANPDAEPVIGKRQIKGILESEEAENLSDDTRRVLQWIVGEIKPVAIKGLSACIKAVQAAKDAKRAEGKPKPPTNKATPEDGAAAAAKAKAEEKAAARAKKSRKRKADVIAEAAAE